MEAYFDFWLPVPIEAMAVFLALIVIALVYYVAKFIITAVLGG